MNGDNRYIVLMECRIKLLPIILGGSICGNLGKEDITDAEDSLLWALDNGVTLFDTAVSYQHGRSEEILGRVFRGRRGRIVLATKFGNVARPDGTMYKDFSVQAMTKAFETSLARLQTD